MLSMFYGTEYILRCHIFGHFAMPFPFCGAKYVLSKKGFKKPMCLCNLNSIATST